MNLYTLRKTYKIGTKIRITKCRGESTRISKCDCAPICSKVVEIYKIDYESKTIDFIMKDTIKNEVSSCFVFLDKNTDEAIEIIE